MVSKKERQKIYYEKTVKMFEEAGCPTTETEYKPAKEKWEYICRECKQIRKICPDDMKNSKYKMCKPCADKEASKNRRTSKEDIIELFKESENTLIDFYFEDNYRGNKGRTIVEYYCKRNHRNAKAIYVYKSGHICAECAKIEASERYRLPREQVRKEFADAGCELLSNEYINMDSPLLYKCSCGREAIGYLSQIRKGIKCGCQYPRGENNPLWNPNLTKEDRILGRSYPEYRQWVKDVYERDDYTCQKCFERGGRLNAHHILSYSKYPELRTELSNGITLCGCCHSQFHSTYGLKKFTENDLIDFLLSD